MSFGRVLEALVFAADRHRDQRRKGADASPYINHPIAVAHTLAQRGAVADEDLIVAALLHDTIEDTETTLEEIEACFGAAVAALVSEVTDDKSLLKEERKRLQIEHAAGLTAKAKQLKIADKICNVRDVAMNPPATWPIQRRVEHLNWTERVVAGCRGVNAALEAAYDDALREARRILWAKS